MRYPLRVSIFLIAAFIFALTCVTPIVAQQNVLSIRMTAADLRTAGITVRSAGVAPLPNSCAAGGTPNLSVSDEMLANFQSRGFSLISLCLGLVSYTRFDPETGKPIPISDLGRNGEYPLNLPDCFRRAVPLLDCTLQFDYDWGGRNNTQQQRFLRELGSAIDGISRRQLNAGNKGIVYPSKECENPRGIFSVHRPVDLCVILDIVIFSAGLPAGYGYALHRPEGGDPSQENVDLSTYRKRSSGLPFWADQKVK